MRATGVAQFLKAGGINTTPRSREGIHVNDAAHDGRVYLSIWTETRTDCARLILAVTDRLTGSHSPYHLVPSPLNEAGSFVWNATVVRKP